MNTPIHSSDHRTILQGRDASGMTIIEISVTLALLMALASVVVFSAAGVSDWKLARTAGLELRSVYVAQKSYLADHPTSDISSVAASDLIPYLPQKLGSIPTVKSLEGNTLSIDFNEMPPVAKNGGTTYDPSGDDLDGLWDVGAR